MITKLSEWYKVLLISNLSQDLLNKRVLAIKKIVKTKDTKWLFDCIRLYLGKQIESSSFEAELIKLFTDSDPLFTQKNNDLELQVLAGAIINEAVETSDEFAIALALETVQFQIDSKKIINPEIIDLVRTNLMDEAISGREFEEEEDDEDSISLSISPAVSEITPEALTKKLTEINEQFKKLSVLLQTRQETNSKRIQVLEEESNIHWWIFRGYSKLVNKPNADLDPNIAPIIIGRELADLTTLLPFTPAFESFIAKVLKDAFPGGLEEIPLKDAINGTLKYFDTEEISSQIKEVGNICPLLNAYYLALQSGDEKGWFSFYEKATGIKPTKKVTSMDLAKQIYLETLLLSSIN